MSAGVSLRRNSLWVLSGQGTKLVLQAAYFVLIGRALGSRQYGAFIGVASMIAALAQFTTWGSGMMMLRSVSIDPRTFSRAWGTALTLTTLLSAAVLMAVYGFGHLVFGPQLLIILPYVAISDTFFAKLVELSSQAFQSVHRLRDTAQLTALSSGIRLFAAAGLFLMHPAVDVSALAWARLYLGASVLAAIVAMIFVTARLGWPKFQKIRKTHWLEGLGFSVAYSTTSIYNDVDKAMLASLGELRAAGIYGTAYRIIDIACAPINAVHAAAMPHLFARGHEGPAALKPFVRKMLSKTCGYAGLIAVALFAGAGIVPFVMGASYAGSVRAIRWLCLLPLLRSMHLAAGDCITATSSQWWRTSSQLFAAVLNLALNLVFIPRWSWQGAACASLLTDGALAVGNWLIVGRLMWRDKHDSAGTAETFLAVEVLP